MVEEIFVPPLRHISPYIKICYTIDRKLKKNMDANFKVIIKFLFSVLQLIILYNYTFKGTLPMDCFLQTARTPLRK